ncbi:hypothetical protein D8674_031241 [Pyrus ussuriensis x Pyrus communis]|uniref:Uncharacterized protein n=1 Tax=Pyrus ussuriensis x Pyrus communis TaxID=2448454 RepID=A0A5N5F0T5_9ROSA|nr:hypothetical protein D8674_031241 [Pyrus ussuriensis x Pyrus communis]
MVVGDVVIAKAASSPSGMPEYKDQYDHYSRRFSELYAIIKFVDELYSLSKRQAALDELGSSADEAGKALLPEYGKKKMVVNGFL